MNLKKHIKNFISPTHSISEIFIASVLTIITIILLFVKQSFILEFFPGVIFTLILSLYTLVSSSLIIFFNKSNYNRLKILQLFGMLLILALSFCYVVTSLIFVNLNNIIDYLFIFYASLVILRTLIIIGIIRTNSIKELGNHFMKMPLAKNNHINFYILIIITTCAFYVYYQNIEILSLALGRSFYISAFLLDIIFVFKKNNKKI